MTCSGKSTEPVEPSFPFESFERSEADAAQQGQPTPHTMETSPVEHRPILRRSYLPPGDVVVDSRPVGNMTVVTLRGRINESFRGGELGRSLGGVVLFDLAEVDRVSSFGVKGWLHMLEKARMESFYLYRCSEAIIHQITMMRNFSGRGRIHSLMVPYSCANCGEEFGALYQAVEDRDYLLGRSPALVACPECGAAAEMDDDPWSYFALDEHLLTEVPRDLERVIEHLQNTDRVDPIEKFVSEQETRIRFNTDVDGRLRLRRAFAGLEGRVTLDLSVTPSVDHAGIQRIVGALHDLDAEVTEVWIDGAPPALVRELVGRPPPRVYVSSMFVEARCAANGIQRAVLVDVERGREALRSRRVPPVEANWATGPVEIADVELLFQAAEYLGRPAQQVFATLPPQSVRTFESMVPAAARTLPPMPMPQREASPVDFFGLSAWQVALGTASVSLVALFLMILVIVALSAQQGLRGPSARANGWDGGRPSPPEWVHEPFATASDAVRVVGRAEGTDIAEVAKRSRLDALLVLTEHLRGELSAPASAALVAAPTGEAAAVAARLQAVASDLLPPDSPARAAIKRSGEQVLVVTQHEIPREHWRALVERFNATATFGGLTVARRFPTDYLQPPHSTTPLVVARVTSDLAASPGDGVEAVGGQPVDSLEQFSSRTERPGRLPGGRRGVTVSLYNGEDNVTLEIPEASGGRSPERPPARAPEDP